MIDYSKYNLAEMQAIVTVLDDLTDEMAETQAIVTVLNDLTDEMAVVKRFEHDFYIALNEYIRADSRAEFLIDQQARDHAAAEAEKVNRIKDACIAGAPPAEEPDAQSDLCALVDDLSRCSDRIAALALLEDRHFEESSEMDAYLKSTVLRNANRSIIDMLSDIRDHFREVLSDD